MTFYSEVVNSLESAKEFCDLNKIEPYMIVVLWDEEEEKGNERKESI